MSVSHVHRILNAVKSNIVYNHVLDIITQIYIIMFCVFLGFVFIHVFMYVIIISVY